MSPRTKVRIRILNEEYTIAGPRPAEEMQAAAAYVSEVLGQISAATADASATKLAVLAAINIASELLELRSRADRIESTIRGGAARMLALLEAHTGEAQDP
jgi:cell division protein ZapA (FtsZ GTPase activity inhibitor)